MQNVQTLLSCMQVINNACFKTKTLHADNNAIYSTSATSCTALAYCIYNAKTKQYVLQITNKALTTHFYSYLRLLVAFKQQISTKSIILVKLK